MQFIFLLLAFACLALHAQTPTVNAGADSRFIITENDTFQVVNGTLSKKNVNSGESNDTALVDLIKNGIYPTLRPSILYDVVSVSGSPTNMELKLQFRYCFEQGYAHCVSVAHHPVDSVLAVDSTFTTQSVAGSHYKQLNSPETARSVKVFASTTGNTSGTGTFYVILKKILGR